MLGDVINKILRESGAVKLGISDKEQTHVILEADKSNICRGQVVRLGNQEASVSAQVLVCAGESLSTACWRILTGLGRLFCHPLWSVNWLIVVWDPLKLWKTIFFTQESTYLNNLFQNCYRNIPDNSVWIVSGVVHGPAKLIHEKLAIRLVKTSVCQ